MATAATWFGGLVVVLAGMTGVWAASVVLRDVSIVDRVWGVAFGVLATAYALIGDGDPVRTTLVLALVWAWGLRLSAHITWRNWGDGEDARYVAMREANAGRNWTLRSLVTVFWLQGVLAWIVSLPLLAALTDPAPPALTVVDVLGVVAWTVGLFFEAVGDWQLARFLADPSNRGKVMDRGLWRYTRHPNYFGDVVVWVGFGLIGLATGTWWAAIGPVVMGLMIVRVSGVALTERTMASGSRREGHEEYVARTNAFLPWFPKDA